MQYPPNSPADSIHSSSQSQPTSRSAETDKPTLEFLREARDPERDPERPELSTKAGAGDSPPSRFHPLPAAQARTAWSLDEARPGSVAQRWGPEVNQVSVGSSFSTRRRDHPMGTERSFQGAALRPGSTRARKTGAGPHATPDAQLQIRTRLQDESQNSAAPKETPGRCSWPRVPGWSLS